MKNSELNLTLKPTKSNFERYLSDLARDLGITKEKLEECGVYLDIDSKNPHQVYKNYGDNLRRYYNERFEKLYKLYISGDFKSEMLLWKDAILWAR